MIFKHFQQCHSNNNNLEKNTIGFVGGVIQGSELSCKCAKTSTYSVGGCTNPDFTKFKLIEYLQAMPLVKKKNKNS